jgi:twitching motility protein PilT
MISSSLQAVISQQLLKKVDNASRVAAFEILMGTGAVRNLIRENQIPQIFSMMQTGSRYGMTTMEDSVKALLEKGFISEETARLATLKTDDEGSSTPSSTRIAASLGGTQRVQAPKALVEDENGGYSF